MKKLILLIIMVSVTIFNSVACSSSSNLGANISVVNENFEPVKDRIEKIRENVMAIEGIDDVSIVITGHTLLMGLYINKDYRHKTKLLKDEAVKLARLADKDISYTSITSNEEIANMIDKIEEDNS